MLFRSKAAISNTVGRVDDIVGKFDKFKEQGLTGAAIITSCNNYLVATTGKDKNPWNTAQAAYGAIQTQTTATTKSAFETGMAVGSLGQAMMWIQAPGANGIGFLGGAVKVQNLINNSTSVKKSVAVE